MLTEVGTTEGNPYQQSATAKDTGLSQDVSVLMGCRADSAQLRITLLTSVAADKCRPFAFIHTGVPCARGGKSRAPENDSGVVRPVT